MSAMTEEAAKALAKSLGDGWDHKFESYRKEWYVWNNYAQVSIEQHTREGVYYAREYLSEIGAQDKDPRTALRMLDEACRSQVKYLRRKTEDMEERARKVSLAFDTLNKIVNSLRPDR